MSPCKILLKYHFSIYIFFDQTSLVHAASSEEEEDWGCLAIQRADWEDLVPKLNGKFVLKAWNFSTWWGNHSVISADQQPSLTLHIYYGHLTPCDGWNLNCTFNADRPHGCCETKCSKIISGHKADSMSHLNHITCQFNSFMYIYPYISITEFSLLLMLAAEFITEQSCQPIIPVWQ